MSKSIYIFSNGEIKRKQNTIYFETSDGNKKYFPVENISEIYIFGEVSLTKKLLEFLTQKEIILHFFNYHGYYVGTYYPREHYNSGYMILKQAEFYLDKEKRIGLAKKFVSGGIENILKVLGYYQNRGTKLDDFIERIKKLSNSLSERMEIDEIMAIEGNIRDIYYESFDRILQDDDFAFEKRTKRPPENRLNALISFGNSLLYVVVLSEIYKTHLDPRIGYLHATNFRKFTLNLDVAEVFKPILVDRLIFSLVNKKMLTKKDFNDDLNGVVLKEKGMKIFVKEWDSKLSTTIKHRGLNRNVSYQTLIRMELYNIEKHLMGDSEYKPYRARW